MTKFASTNATLFSDCDHCGVVAGEYCIMPSGRKARLPHIARMKTFHNKYGITFQKLPPTSKPSKI